MSDAKPVEYTKKKAYEVAYALFRVAAKLDKKSFKENIEENALRLIVSVVAGESVKSRTSIAVLRHLLKFGEDVGVLNPANCNLLVSELGLLNSAIAELDEPASPGEIDLRKIFSHTPAVVMQSASTQVFSAGADYPVVSKPGLNGNVSSGNNGYENGNGNIVKAAMRQSAILERIRQNHDCRLKDIQEALQDVSERTVRYDLQNLLEQGLIERFGNGGPATFYRVKN